MDEFYVSKCAQLFVNIQMQNLQQKRCHNLRFLNGTGASDALFRSNLNYLNVLLGGEVVLF